MFLIGLFLLVVWSHDTEILYVERKWWTDYVDEVRKPSFSLLEHELKTGKIKKQK